ncbi:hypothetical protein CR513_18773, partial [Mucuna pruriens]
MYDPVEKKLVRSRDVQFMEDQTIEDIDKNGEEHNYGDQQLGDGFDVLLDNDAEEEQEMSQNENLGDAPESPLVQLKRSNRQRQLSTRSTFDEYVTLTDGKEPKCYQESMESEERQKAWQSKLQKCVVLSTTKAKLGFVRDEHWLLYDVRYHWIRDALDAKLLELPKVHIDDNGVDTMTKMVPSGNLYQLFDET